MHGVCAVSSDEGPCACHASRTLRRACGQGAVLSLCVVRPGSERFGSVWGGILGGILGGIARAGLSHRESALPDSLNSRFLRPEPKVTYRTTSKNS